MLATHVTHVLQKRKTLAAHVQRKMRATHVPPKILVIHVRRRTLVKPANYQYWIELRIHVFMSRDHLNHKPRDAKLLRAVVF